jgi:hypothetical protein
MIKAECHTAFSFNHVFWENYEPVDILQRDIFTSLLIMESNTGIYIGVNFKFVDPLCVYVTSECLMTEHSIDLGHCILHPGYEVQMQEPAHKGSNRQPGFNSWQGREIFSLLHSVQTGSGAHPAS